MIAVAGYALSLLLVISGSALVLTISVEAAAAEPEE